MEKIAYFDASHDCPEEIIMAAGFTPFKILGDVHESNDPADRYLQNYFCPAARSFLTEALAHSKEWAGIVVGHGCDATNRQFDVWKMHVETPFLYWFNNPMNQNATAGRFMKKELLLMIQKLEEHYKVEITPAKVQLAIKESNRVKSLMQQLAALRGDQDIPNWEYFETCVKAVTWDRDKLIPELEKLLGQWRNRPGFAPGKKKILLTGSDVTYVEWMTIMDEANLRVVRDDLSIGERYFANLIPEAEEGATMDVLLDNLVDYYFNIPRPATKNPPDPRLGYLLKAMKDSSLDGVVSQNVKFCEPYAFDSVYTINALKEKGYKTIHLEREFVSNIDSQLLTRLEAFREML